MTGDRPSPENPFNLLVCDTDALIQVICAEQIDLLKKLEKIYGIRPVVTEAVEDEITNPTHRRASLVDAPFQKAIDSGVLTVLSRRTIRMFTTNDPYSTYDSIELRGQDYSKIVQRGEAYTHAAAVVLRAAAMSNDASAIRTLDRTSLPYGSPVLRTYDLFALFAQRGDLSERDCDAIRKRLVAIGEHPHPQFEKSKFIEGISRFYPRLLDKSLRAIGAEIMRELGDERRCQILPMERATARRKSGA